MIHEVDDALRRLLREEALGPTDVDVVLEAPTREWAARRSGPTVDLYLYDIREDLRRRERGMINEYDERGTIVARRPPPRHVKLSYLLTAWTQRPEDEHRLLASMLSVLLGHEVLPEPLLGPALAEQGGPIPLAAALPPPEDRSFADVWNALGGELKPSLDGGVTVPVGTGRRWPTAPPPDTLVADLARWEPQP